MKQKVIRKPPSLLLVLLSKSSKSLDHSSGRSIRYTLNDILRLSSPRVQILRWHSGWSLAISAAFAGKSKRKAMMGFLESEVQFH